MTVSEAPLSFGYLLPTHSAVLTGRPQAGPLIDLARRAELSGLDEVWVADSPFAAGLHDPLTMLAAVAGVTHRVTLGTGVLLAAMRPAALLAQAAATLDRVCDGRLVLGLGSGFASDKTRHQFEAAGVAFERRAARLAETIEAARRLWAAGGSPVSFDGEHVRFTDVVLSPTPHQPGGPPVWLAGAGPAAERRVGRLADGWLPYTPTAEQFRAAWANVARSAAEAGRTAPPGRGLYVTVALDDDAGRAQERLQTNVERWYGYPFAVVSSLQAMYAGPAAGLAEALQPYVEAGVERVVVRVADDDFSRGLEALAQAAAGARIALAGAGGRPA